MHHVETVYLCVVFDITERKNFKETQKVCQIDSKDMKIYHLYFLYSDVWIYLIVRIWLKAFLKDIGYNPYLAAALELAQSENGYFPCCNKAYVY
ncbi:hypothetical protein NQ317_013651 [Molorchus minor]|uniref:Uncharacterized protein n=1 Tax=Molorchus minor TaxID=1323400 RepID=A0ABQ9JXA7_9CUCU|nr:hypothetical protein NQ317_013651 [Molorchus minor]